LARTDRADPIERKNSVVSGTGPDR